MSGLQDAVDGVLARYAMAIDDDRLEDWLELFAEDCRYRIAARDNVEAGLPVSVVYADGRAMLADRVAALRRANVYEAQRYRHVVGRALVEAGPPVTARAGYHVARIMREGDLMLFSAGEYRAVFDEALRIREMTVVYDNARIDTLLALPL